MWIFAAAVMASSRTRNFNLEYRTALKSLFDDKIWSKRAGAGQGSRSWVCFWEYVFLVKFIGQIYPTYKLTGALHRASFTPVTISTYYVTYPHCIQLQCVDRLLCCFCESGPRAGSRCGVRGAGCGRGVRGAGAGAAGDHIPALYLILPLSTPGAIMSFRQLMMAPMSFQHHEGGVTLPSVITSKSNYLLE